MTIQHFSCFVIPTVSQSSRCTRKNCLKVRTSSSTSFREEGLQNVFDGTSTPFGKGNNSHIFVFMSSLHTGCKFVGNTSKPRVVLTQPRKEVFYSSHYTTF